MLPTAMSSIDVLMLSMLTTAIHLLSLQSLVEHLVNNHTARNFLDIDVEHVANRNVEYQCIDVEHVNNRNTSTLASIIG
jgi:hypothetical protein